MSAAREAMVYARVAKRAAGAFPSGEVARIQGIVAGVFNVPLGRLTGPTYRREFVPARHAAILLCRDMTGASLPAIGRAFSRDHTSIMFATRAAKARLLWDTEFAGLYARAESLCRAALESGT